MKRRNMIETISRKYIAVLILSFFMLTAGTPAQAKDKWDVELRTGVSSATQELGESELNNGVGFEATVAYAFMPHLSAYLGWGWNQFKSDETDTQPEMTFEETGYTFGLQFTHPIGQSGLGYMVRAGGVFNHIELEDKEGEIVEDTGHEMGWQIGAGLEIPLGDDWQLLPGVRYRALSTDLETNGTETELDLTYYSIGAGLSRSF